MFKKSLIRQEGDSHALAEDIKSNDPAYATTRANITMDTNPAYGTATIIKMDTNPPYAATSHFLQFLSSGYSRIIVYAV